ncbi:hypothetical protein [Natronobacterium gregoryi]|uniref:Uncharacterized protein n=2 Tax=Natronobacterium gregoryi TaxID=44930 RepID=L0AEM0_NATGS|nr:hypothetical protein [Natronobacterium gregoryi]AFZ71879.1 hypothetical protein Natgr_0631 [Natronobacterium gregoryi SP2]SFJ51142.1 hypothetical protein SAMN05443661_13534 [Natronobacterium gregoryi]
MMIRTNTPSTWMQGLELPSRLLDNGDSDYERYEEDDEFETGPRAEEFDEVLESAEAGAE